MTIHVLGHRGYLGSVVERRWRERGGFPVPLESADYVVNCIRPDNLILSQTLMGRRVIHPSTDAIHEDTDYARGKRLLEAMPGVTIRAGIVDVRHELPVAWTNWLCNPLTPLEWADLAWDLKDAAPAVHMAGRETVSRWEVETTVAALWGRPLPEPRTADVPRSRVVHDPVRTWPRLAAALLAFREWAE